MEAEEGTGILSLSHSFFFFFFFIPNIIKIGHADTWGGGRKGGGECNGAGIVDTDRLG